MKTIAFVNKKGGSGKTTALCALALYWAVRAKKRVAVMDMEAIGPAEAFVDLIDHPNLSTWEEGGEYDYLLIDTEGNASEDEIEEIKALSDVIVIPVMISPQDIQKAVQTVQMLRGKSTRTPKNIRVLISRVDSRTTAWKNHEEYLKPIKAKPLEGVLRQRSSYRYFMVEGWKSLKSNSEAMDELETLAWELS